ncbi:tRNA (adenosine(37)-N6)-threonylcarbamoyltransferase complex ATPase subunit type 1 TsaE [Flavobacterium sp. NRK F10]|uniref:tRNA threonylcarbamoyladenosine biosynthesis protein TsaE n=1 Tax=Flavobacterium sediminis TaxID=2201181 RepID=A0A2U8QYX3_9FLAO|nr:MULTISPECIES: tRNA (adenosine(37)-N6)-threonylcarbamoyltransferase complex ATPase subunit type 1 TsaE [Flavobacterium]AWM15054.1 tRNA (adenosine(37)-N6)-threonylcarbamoyltransferase complex ATPase subunit type 1 TsaE [Flavobacterium sediminis]MCO6176331.1 tRNA (adenosine(37)-N6)-threonylcarbamoyltransferase complex ATPase subunit type 1 TsaE [Flavobacterium sp. NRK F10]
MTLTYSLDEIENVAKEILAIPLLKKVITFHAEMGAGKTTLIKALVKELGVADNSSSPTFSLVNEYEDLNGDPVYHFDLYRLNSEEEAYDMGIDEYFYSGNWCFIEWPEKTPNLIPIDHAAISIKVKPGGKRELQIKN